MKLATLADGSRDGSLLVVRRDLAVCADATDVAPTLQAALDDWERAEPLLRARARAVEAGEVPTRPFDPRAVRSPLPRAYEWVDGSAFVNHVVLVRKARGADLPPSLWTDPLVYQGGSGDLLDPTAPFVLRDPAWGLDFEGEVVVVLGDVPVGTTAAEAGAYVRLVGLANDWTLRHLVPVELAKGFGFFQSKPATAFSPVFVTPDELGPAWRDGRLHHRLTVTLDGVRVGHAHAGSEMHFSFHDLIAHLARTRAYTAGTVVGSGTVSNEDPDAGYSCLAEIRMREILAHGAPVTPFLTAGRRIRVEMFDEAGRSIFGAIEQEVVAP